MAQQKKHKKRKQHTKVKLTAEQIEQAEAQSEAAKKAAEKKGFLAKKSSKDAGKVAAKKDYNKSAAKGKDGKPAKEGIFRRFINWCKSVKAEMQRVVWPTRKELVNASLIVVGAIIFFGVYIAIVDNIIVIPLDLISTLGA